MNKFIALLVVLVCCGCTSLKPVEMSPETLQQQISSGELVKPGDNVRVVTTDGKRHDFDIIAIGDGLIVGESVSLAISDIVAVETRNLSVGKTALLAGGSIVAFQVLAALAAVATFL